MSYVDHHLLTGETVTFRTHVHWKIYGLPLLLVLVVLAPLTWLAAAKSSTPALALVPAGLALVVLGIAWLRRRGSEFAVTNKRVIIKLGVLSTRSIELLLPKIEGIEVLQSLGGRVFGFGEIIVTGSGGTKEVFDGIQSPLDFRQAVQAATESPRSPST